MSWGLVFHLCNTLADGKNAGKKTAFRSSKYEYLWLHSLRTNIIVYLDCCSHLPPLYGRSYFGWNTAKSSAWKLSISHTLGKKKWVSVSTYRSSSRYKDYDTEVSRAARQRSHRYGNEVSGSVHTWQALPAATLHASNQGWSFLGDSPAITQEAVD